MHVRVMSADPRQEPAVRPEQQQVVQRVRMPDGNLELVVAYGRGEVVAPAEAASAWLVLRGHVRLHAQEGDFLLGARDWIVLGPGSPPLALPGCGGWLLGVSFGAGDGAGLLPGRGRLGPGGRALASRLWRERDASGAHDAASIRAFLASLQDELSAGAARCPGHTERRKRQVLLRMQRARLCLDGQADGGLPIAELAKRVNFSPWYFSKVFHAVYGIPPQQYAARCRLERASRLLATTSLPVTEVSAACGFDNPCSFARAFRARYGMTASEHRMQAPR
jgi:AraC family transcriptional regulator